MINNRNTLIGVNIQALKNLSYLPIEVISHARIPLHIGNHEAVVGSKSDPLQILAEKFGNAKCHQSNSLISGKTADIIVERSNPRMSRIEQIFICMRLPYGFH
jgi:hypothetical protein